MVNTETLETLGKQKWSIQTLETLGNQKWSIQKHWKHWANKNGQYRDTGNIGQPRMVNTETLETLGKQKWSIQRHWKHWANKNGQYRNTGNIGQDHFWLPNVSSVSVLTILVCPMFPVSLY
jgi:nitrogen fixation-related uncharacterized protein